MDTKDAYTSVFLKEAGEDASDESIKKYRPVFWFNVRSKNNAGLRLTEQGITFIEEQAKIRTYKIDLPKDISISPQLLVWLDQQLDSPFFLTKKQITVLREKAAFEIYLFSGDIKKMGYAKAMSKRLKSETSL